MFIDAHAHLDAESFDLEPERLLRRALEAGVDQLVVVGCGVGPSEAAVRLARAHPGRVFAAVGIHPHDVAEATDEDRAAIAELARLPEVVAVGETGLDYHYDHSPRPRQREAFAWHLALAAEVDKPVVIHTREAEEDTVAVLRETGVPRRGGQLHCFTSDPALAWRGIETFGLHVSFSGVLTFHSADPLRALAAELPAERLLVETDCPYLTPAPFRGQKNEPAFVTVVAGRLAEVRGEALEVTAARCAENTRRLFGLPPSPGTEMLAFASGRRLHLRVDHPRASPEALLEAAGRWPARRIDSVDLLSLSGAPREALLDAARGLAAEHGWPITGDP